MRWDPAERLRDRFDHDAPHSNPTTRNFERRARGGGRFRQLGSTLLLRSPRLLLGGLLCRQLLLLDMALLLGIALRLGMVPVAW